MTEKKPSSRLGRLLARDLPPHVHHAGVDEKTAMEQATPRVSEAQLKPIVKKLRAVFLNAIAEARACGMVLTPAHCGRVIDEALLECANPAHSATFRQDVEGAYLLSLYEELIQQPSNIFDVVTREDGRQYYVALSSDIWRRCLERLKHDLAVSS